MLEDTIVIVSRHPAAVEFIRQAAGLSDDVAVLETATEEDIRGKVVYGNLPLGLAAVAKAVVAVEFDGPPPRGTEYGIDDMRMSGAKLRTYVVKPASPEMPGPDTTDEWGNPTISERWFLCEDGVVRTHSQITSRAYGGRGGAQMEDWRADA